MLEGKTWTAVIELVRWVLYMIGTQRPVLGRFPVVHAVGNLQAGTLGVVEEMSDTAEKSVDADPDRNELPSTDDPDDPDDDRSNELRDLIKRSDYPKAVPVDGGIIEAHPRRGLRFAVQGRTTHLGLTLISMVSVFVFTVWTGNPVSEARILMAEVGFTSLAILVLDKNKQ
jgi:hypothetical protein